MPPNLTHPADLTSRQRKAIEALLATGDIASAAREAQVSRDTLHRWMKQPVFNQTLREAEARAIDDLSRILVRLGRTATATLAKAMTDVATPMNTRVRAADISLSRLLQLRELATLEARVSELEQSVALSEGPR